MEIVNLTHPNASQTAQIWPDIVGGKAWGLYQLSVMGFSVPPAAVVVGQMTDTLKELRKIDVLLGGWEQSPVAVRSSGLGEDGIEISMAGIHESVLNVSGKMAVAIAIHTVRASAFSPQAMAYRDAMGLAPPADNMPVVIQQMVGDPVASAVGFSCDPVTGKRDVVVEAVPGLGDAMVRGEVTPTRFRFPEAGGIATEAVGTHQMTRSWRSVPFGDLAGEIIRLREGLATEVDVEAVWDGDDWQLVQCRPVTSGATTTPSEVDQIIERGAGVVR